jgi:hypothetical protein
MKPFGFRNTADIGRREWLSACVETGLILAAPLRCRALQQDLPDSRYLVSTPAKRAEYLKNMLHVLCTELGPRPACSQACEAGAQIIKREMERALPLVELDTFAITGWELAGETELRVAGERLETYLAQNSPGTSEAGIRGVIRKTPARTLQYEIADQHRERALARIDTGPFGPAVASLYRGDDGIPRFSVGKQDIPLLDKAARENLPVFAKAQVKLIPNCRTSNVAGTLPGASTDEILYVAHADTKYNSPGASDNTASMIAMLMLAHAISGTRPRRTVTFLASAAEEIGSVGAEHYAQSRKAKGTLGRVKFCVNLDSLTYGPNLQIYTTDWELQRMILDIHRDLGIHSDPKVFQRDDTMDSAPFKAAGARTVYFNSRGHDARTLPLNHRPDDRADTIYPELIESSFQVLLELTQRLERLAG